MRPTTALPVEDEVAAPARPCRPRRPWRSGGGRMRRIAALPAALAVVAAVSGCGVRSTDAVRYGDLPRVTAQPNQVAVYLVKNGMLVRVSRPGLLNQPYLGLQQLTVKPTDAELQEGYRTALPRGVTLTADSTDLDPSGLLTVRVNRANVNWPPLTLGQVVCTAAASPNVRMVRLDYPISVAVPEKGGGDKAAVGAAKEMDDLFRQMAIRYTCNEFSSLVQG